MAADALAIENTVGADSDVDVVVDSVQSVDSSHTNTATHASDANGVVVHLSKEDKSQRPQCVARIAPRASDVGIPKQCSRKSKVGSIYCGTHLHGQPYGVVSKDDMYTNIESVLLWCQDVEGIIYHFDSDYNVYHTYDVVRKIANPRIVGRWSPSEPEPYDGSSNGGGLDATPRYSASNQPVNPYVTITPTVDPAYLKK